MTLTNASKSKAATPPFELLASTFLITIFSAFFAVFFWITFPATFFRGEDFFAALDFTAGDFRVFRDIFLEGALLVCRVQGFLPILFFFRGEAFFTATAGVALDFIVGVLRAGIFLDFRVVFGVAFDFLIGVFFVSNLAVALFLASALALLFEA